jgi:hypothetical protein
MNANAFDIATRRTVAAISRRASLLTLGSAALAAAASRPREADAAKAGKKCKKRCKRQGEQCRAKTEDVCAGAVDPTACREFFRPVCEALGRCNAGPLLQHVIVLS